MKMRYGFVSNSSSSSFIVISNIGGWDKVNPNQIKDDCLVVDSSLGCSEFGWEQDTHCDCGSKIIFASLQAQYVIEKHPEYMDMLNKVITEYVGCKGVAHDSTDDLGYIDHQSASYEGDNTEMFHSEEDLKNFLFNYASYIETDNDNY